MTKRLDPARDDAGARLRTARLRRGMTQIALAEMACVSASFVSMVETGQRKLTRVCDIAALADVLRVSPLYLADGWDDHLSPGQRPTWAVPFPARCAPIMLARHQQLAAQFVGLARQDGRTARGLAAPTGPRTWCASLAAARPTRHAPAPPQITQG